MEKFGLIGYPIAHSLSPKLFKEAYDGRWDYDLLEYTDFETAWNIFLSGPYKAINITAPFKARAAAACDVRSAEVVASGAANIAVKRDDGLHAHNSDVLAVKHLLSSAQFPHSSAPLSTSHAIASSASPLKVAVIGGGGAGRAALVAAESLGLSCRLYHHDELAQGPIEADTIVFTLPRAVPGLENLRCNTLIEANYKDPCCASLPHFAHYISGIEWLRLQAALGYALMTSLEPKL